jgi:hypothetical protein
VGIVEGSGSQDGVDIAQYAAWNEEGTKNIPARPFIRSWVDNNQEKIDKMMQSVYNHVQNGKWTAKEAMQRLGEFGQAGIRANIRNGGFAPNAPATVQKKTKGKGGVTTPLIDTGTMRNAVRYEVVKK